MNEGEENALFKAMHCTLLRCPGPGSCADPLMCAAALFPNAQKGYRFWPAWRARESEIKTLARRGYEKKKEARRFEALHDTTLCKVLQSTAKPHSEEPMTTPEARAASRMLQIDLQRWFRQLLRHLRVNAQPESPCNYGYTERIVHQILLLLSDVTSPIFMTSNCIWPNGKLCSKWITSST